MARLYVVFQLASRVSEKQVSGTEIGMSRKIPFMGTKDLCCFSIKKVVFYFIVKL